MKPLAIITGASRGIGLATAQRLQNAGYDIINLSRSECALENVENISADLIKPLANAQIVALTSACQSAASVAIVHCAGYLKSDSAQTIGDEQLETALAVNVSAPALLNQQLLPALPRGSAIIFIGSTLGDKAVAGSLSYVVSKHALHGLMKATCQDLAGSGIHTAVVAPGFTDTQMLREHIGNDEGILKHIASSMCFDRLIEPDEIAKTVEFCIHNPVINGAVIHANLGQIER